VIASDGVDHVWDSYKGTFDLVIGQRDVPRILAAIAERLTLIYGRDDRVCPLNQVEPVVRDVSGVTLTALPVGDHHLPLRFPARCRELIRDASGTERGVNSADASTHRGA
jgi:pimeloyl-ACP methyl ester carboxylesterase